MAASRTAADTIPGELSRQAERVEEQLQRLNDMLTKTDSHLASMNEMMKNYSPELVRQINLLRESLNSYRTKAGNIYGEISQSLYTYSKNLLNNLDNLTASVSNVTNAVKEL